MKKFTIDQAYGELQWRTVQVQAETLERALELAYEADGFDYDSYASGPSDHPADKEGVVSCDEWSGGDGGAGETFVTDIAEGAFLDRAYHVENEEGATHIDVPEEHGSFAAEYPTEFKELRALRETSAQLAEAISALASTLVKRDALAKALRYALDCVERGDTSDMQPVRDALEG